MSLVISKYVKKNWNMKDMDINHISSKHIIESDYDSQVIFREYY